MPDVKKTGYMSVITRGLFFFLVWWVLVGGDSASLWVGLPAILIAIITSYSLMPATGFKWLYFFKFMPFFLSKSFMGGVDVAKRVFKPGMPISPNILVYSMQTPAYAPKFLMIIFIGLMPGTLVVKEANGSLLVHVIDDSEEYLSELIRIEKNIMRMFDNPQSIQTDEVQNERF